MSNLPIGTENHPNAPYNEISHRVRFLILCEKIVSIKTRPDATEDDIEIAAKEALSDTVLKNYMVDIKNIEIL